MESPGRDSKEAEHPQKRAWDAAGQRGKEPDRRAGLEPWAASSIASVWLSFPAPSPGVGEPSHPILNMPPSPLSLRTGGVWPWMCKSAHELSEAIKGSRLPSPAAGLTALRRLQFPTEQLFRPDPKHQLMVYG